MTFFALVAGLLIGIGLDPLRRAWYRLPFEDPPPAQESPSMNPVVAKLFGQVIAWLEPVLLVAGKQIVQMVIDEVQAWLNNHPGQMPPSATA